MENPEQIRVIEGLLQHLDRYVRQGSEAQEYLTFGRNEPALHHDHNTYRAALGLPPLETISN
jgi:hypothetical protein